MEVAPFGSDLLRLARLTLVTVGSGFFDQAHATKETRTLQAFNLQPLAAGVRRSGPRWGSPSPHL
jgi:hypothetical protein